MPEVDFNVEEDAIDEPLIPNGPYAGAITSAKFNEDIQLLELMVTLADNGGEMSDGTTPIDGAVIPFKVWYPKVGDKDLMTGSGKSTKHQWKVNNIKKVYVALGINLESAVVLEGIESGEWVGIPVQVKIEINEYEGQTSNQINQCKRV